MQPRGSDNTSAMLMKRLRTVITDKKLTMHSMRHRIKDNLHNTGWMISKTKLTSTSRLLS